MRPRGGGEPGEQAAGGRARRSGRGRDHGARPTKTEARQVGLGASDDSYVQILSRLSQGETVLVPGQDQVQTDGSVVMTDSGGEG